MAFEYKKRFRKLFDPSSKEPFKVSRSKIDLFLECPRCFYLDARLGVRRPDIPGFTLNMAVDQLLKKEFDLLRENGEAHELMKKYKIDAVPLKHPDLAEWRDDYYRYVGAKVFHKKSNLDICGIIDDVWVGKNGELFIVDYKSTSTKQEISLEDKWKQGYKIQMEIYQWIFRRLGFNVSNTGYFVFANAQKTPPKFDGRLEFELTIIPHQGDDSWVEGTLLKIKDCLVSDEVPEASENCEYCSYRTNIVNAVKKQRAEG